MKQRQLWTVTVSNLGMVYSGFSESKARKTFDEYKEHVAAPRGRVSGETVALFRNDDAHGIGYGDVVAEYTNEFQSFRQGTRKENPMKHFREPFHVDFHSERGEVSIYVTDADDNEVWYADTDTVNELVEDGFLDTRGFIMGRNARPDVLEKSVIGYLRSMGIIPDLSEKHSPRVCNPIEKNPPRPRRENPLIKTVADFRKALSDGPYAWPGGYPMFFITADGGALSFKTAKENQTIIADAIASRDRHSGWCVEGVDVNWENNDLYDDHSGEKIESAYGENPRSRRPNPTQTDVDTWVNRYRTSMEKRIDGVPEKAHYIVKIVTKDGQDAWLRVGKGTKFDTDPAKARVYRNGDKANEAATKVANWLKKKQPAKWKKIASISAEAKK